MKYALSLSIVSGLVVLATGCGNFFDSMDESEIPGYTKNWLREHHGEVLTFRNAAGQTRTLTVARKEEILRGSSKTGTYEHERITIWYRDGPDSLLNLRLQARANAVYIARRGNGVEFADISTYKSDGHTAFSWVLDNRRFLRTVTQDTVFNGQSHRYLGFVQVPPVEHVSDTLTTVYFSRYNGLVGFQTKRGGLWARQ